MTRVTGIVSAKAVTAAADKGDAKGDKARKAKLAELSHRASVILDALPPEKFPDVVEAAKSIQAVMDISVDLDEAQLRLQKTPQNTEEAEDAQRLLDGVRANVDAMMLPLAATMQSMVRLLHRSLELEQQAEKVSAEAKQIEQALSQEKARLAAAAKAVQSASQIG